MPKNDQLATKMAKNDKKCIENDKNWSKLVKK